MRPSPVAIENSDLKRITSAVASGTYRAAVRLRVDGGASHGRKSNSHYQNSGNGSTLRPSLHYESKFANFIKLCEATDQDTVVVVAAPEALGDNYGELVESLTGLARAGLTLAIVGESWHGTEDFEPPRRDSDFAVRKHLHADKRNE